METRRPPRDFTPSLNSILFLVIASLCASSGTNLSVFASEENQRVSLDLYYETLCPGCSNFIANYLPKLFHGGLLSIVDLKLVPFGNGKIGSDHTITCQHGPSECLLNSVEACAIDILVDLDKYFPFIYCIESLVHEGNYTQWESCFAKLGLDPKPITDCYSSSYGNELELKYAAETYELQPPHRYVPWVVVDGQPLYDNYTDFVSYICKAYKGSSLPSACSESLLNIVTEEKANPTCSIWFSEQTTKATSKIISAVTSRLSWI